MNLLGIALRHARAKRLRTALLVAIFALGVASMTALHEVSNLVGDAVEKKMISFGANILVTPKRETLTVGYGGYTLGDVTLEERRITLSSAYAAINAMPLRANVAIIAPKLLGVTFLGNTPAALVGVDWQEEFALKGYWSVDGEMPAADGTDEVLAGVALARRFGLVPGQKISTAGHELIVSGVLHPTGGDDDNVLFAPLSLVQKLTGKFGQAGFLEVAALCAGCPIDDIVAQLQAALPDTEVRALRQVAQSRMYAIRFAQHLAFLVSLVILVTACAMIVMFMFSAVTEQRKEIGIMRAVGFSRASVFGVFVAEALGVGALAGALGDAAGYLLAGYVLRHLPLTDASASMPAFDLAQFIFVSAGVACVAALAAALPARQAALVEPAEALTAL